MQVPLAGVRWSPSGTGAQSPGCTIVMILFSNDWALKSLISVHLHHVPDLLRLTALNKLVQGQQSLSMGPSRKLWHLWVTCVNFMTILWLWSHIRPSPQSISQHWQSYRFLSHNNHDHHHQLTQSKISWGGFSLSGMSWRPCTRRLGPGRGLAWWLL